MAIRTRLFLSLVGAMALGAGVLTAVVLWSFHRFFLESSRADIEARTKAIAESVADSLATGSLDRVGLVVRRYGAQEGISLRVLDLHGRLIATSEDAPAEQQVDWTTVPGVASALAGEIARGRATAVTGDDERLYVSMPVVRDGKPLAVVRMARTLAELQKHERRTLVTVVGALAGVLALSAVLSAFLARSFARPIQRMRNFAVRMGQGQLRQRLDPERHDELGELSIELNRMSERLAALEDERRAFLANASHELRTPVSNINVTLQALESGAAEDADLRSRFLTTALDETGRLKRLVQDLLDLGRLEAGVTGLERSTVPMRALVERATRAVESRALARGIIIDVEPGGEELVHVDRERVIQALVAILDNALKFSPAGSTLHVSAAGREIRIRDEGPGIDAADLPHVFEQFYTADRSRKRGGTGLGLAIARRIVEAQGGTIAAANSREGGATFVVELPGPAQS
jgi:signal transduction histidine kinase